MSMTCVRIHGVAALAGACALAGCATLQDTPAKDAVAKEAVVAAAAAVSPQAIANAQRLAGAPGSNPPTAAPAPPSLAEDFRRCQPRREGVARAVPPLAKGRKGVAGTRARSIRPRVFLFDQPRPGAGREPVPRRFDGQQPVAALRRARDRDLPQGRRQRADDRAQRQIHGAGRNAGGARRGRRLFRQPARDRRGGVAAAPGTQIRAGGSQRAVLHRPARRGIAPRAGLPAILRVRRPQFVVPRNPQHARISFRSM